MQTDPSIEIREVLSHYDLGNLVNYEPDRRGTVNTSFAIQTSAKGGIKRYFLRRYKSWIQEEELILEHAVINHLKEQGFHLVAGVFRTRDGATYVRRQVAHETLYYAIFEFLEGEDKYTWIDPVPEPEELISSAITLARFHQAMAGWTPPGKRNEPKIDELLPSLPGIIANGLSRSKGTVFDVCLEQYQERLNRHLAQTLQALAPFCCAGLPQLVIHGDYHPGNLKFRDGEVVGLFDFDWCKVEARCFDVALALFYFFCSWQAERDGSLRLDDLGLFLKAYQTALQGSAEPGSLNRSELQALPSMLQAGNLYVLNWCFQDYYKKRVDPHEYLRYLQHGLRCMTWLEQEANRQRLEETIAATCG